MTSSATKDHFTCQPWHACLRLPTPGLWDTLRMYGVRLKLFEGIESFYENRSASVRVNIELSESFNVKVGVRQGCVMSL